MFVRARVRSLVRRIDKKGKSKKEKKKKRSFGNKTRSKSSESKSARSRSSATRRAKNEQNGGSVTYLTLEEWDTRGVRCMVCDVRDSDQDNIFPQKKRLWGHAPRYVSKTGSYVTCGKACLLCVRVQNALYYPAIKLQNMKDKLGADAALYEDLCFCFCSPLINIVSHRKAAPDSSMRHVCHSTGPRATLDSNCTVFSRLHI